MRGTERAVKDWGVGRRVAWIGLALMLLRALELFTDDDGNVHTVYFLEGDVASMRANATWKEGIVQIWTQWRCVLQTPKPTRAKRGYVGENEE